ncbi:MAG: DUF4124 domain-containing protein [Acidiferrobacterales bacterium]
MRAWVLATVLVGVMCGPSAHAVKLYKWVDEEGNVTYQDRPPPPHHGGKVKEKTIDPDAGVTKFVVPEPSSTPTAQEHTGKPQASQGAGSASDSTVIIGVDERRRTDRRRGIVPTPAPRPAAPEERPRGPQAKPPPGGPRR